MKPHLLLGTAGHIDHGKTALVAALAGVDTDRLPDEKRRKITIELGFAPLELENCFLGIVDVPGHERFIKNMLAGATGVDLALLVVAADDSVKPQTREHLEILEYLQIEAGVIAITKCDLAEPNWIEMVEHEVQELTACTRLESAPLVRVSAKTGAGIDQLRAAISSAAEQANKRRAPSENAPFRMAVDRAFTVTGYGTVVTGSVASGQVSVGDELELQPQGDQVRIRGLQSHDQTVEQVGRGQRAAINLGGIHYDQVTRGQSLASRGSLKSSRLLTVQLRWSERASRPAKKRERIRFHVGTAEIQGVLSLLGTQTLEPGRDSFAQFTLAENVAVVWGQPFVIRSVSPVETLGGGRVLDGGAERIRRWSNRLDAHLQDLASDDDPLRRAAASAYFMGLKPWQAVDLFVSAGVEEYQGIVDQLVADKTLRRFDFEKSQSQLLHRDVVDEVSQRIEARLALEHNESPLHAAVEHSRLSKYFPRIAPRLFAAILALLQSEGRVLIQPRGIALASWNPQLSPRQQELLQRIDAAFRGAGFQPPDSSQLAESLGERFETVSPLLEVATEQGTLVRITGDMIWHGESVEEAKILLSEALGDGQSLSISQIRELLGTTRKFAVPFCEYLDRLGFTCREGDGRTLANREPSTST